MRRFGSVAAVSVIALTAVHALAQQSPNLGTSEPPYGYSHMWGGGWGWHPGMMIAPIVMLLALVGIVTLIMWLVRCVGYGGCCHWHRHGPCPHCGHWRGRAALDILEERLAKGEIGKDEFEEKGKLLGR